MADEVVVVAVRSAVGTRGGAFRSILATELLGDVTGTVLESL